MLEVGAVKSRLAEDGVREDLRSLVLERPIRKAASIKLPPNLDATTAWVISSDGSFLFACGDPWRLFEFDLSTGRPTRTLDLPRPSPALGRRVGLDSCDISVSQDNRFAAVSILSDHGERRMALLALGEERAPAFSVEDYEFGVFFGDCLVLARKPDSLRVMRVGAWADIPVIGAGHFNLGSIASEPDGSVFVMSAGGISTFRYDAQKQRVSMSLGSSENGTSWVDWVPTRDRLFAYYPLNCFGHPCLFFLPARPSPRPSGVTCSRSGTNPKRSGLAARIRHGPQTR
jgi:hypothetical protein